MDGFPKNNTLRHNTICVVKLRYGLQIAFSFVLHKRTLLDLKNIKRYKNDSRMTFTVFIYVRKNQHC